MTYVIVRNSLKNYASHSKEEGGSNEIWVLHRQSGNAFDEAHGHGFIRRGGTRGPDGCTPPSWLQMYALLPATKHAEMVVVSGHCPGRQ